jgi:hypothetical protein
MAIYLVQEKEEVQVFSYASPGKEMGSLFGLDCFLFEKFIWVLKKYPLRLDVSEAIVAVTDFIRVSFHISEMGIVPDKSFLVIPLRELKDLTYRNIIELVNMNTPAC